MNPRSHFFLMFFVGTLLAAGLSFGATVVFRDVIIPQVQPAVVTMIGDAQKDKTQTQLQDVRDRVLPAVIPMIHRAADGSVSVDRAFRVALGLTSDGYVLTTAPVPTDTLFVLADGTALPAKEISIDQTLGLAIVKIDATHIPVVRFGESAFVQPGTDVHVVMPKRIERTVVAGTVVPDDRRIVGANELLRRLIAPAQLALQGSPVAEGENVLGIMLDVKNGYALPSDAFAPMVTRFLKTKRISHPAIGADISESGRSAVIKVIHRGSAAEKAGLKIGDVITSIEGEMLQPDRSLAEILEQYDASSTVEMLVRRGNTDLKIQVQLTQNPAK